MSADARPTNTEGQSRGWMTLADGRHVPITPAQADALLAAIKVEDAERQALMPTERDAIEAMFSGWLRLKELGWREAMYCPKDGSLFEIIEAGSTGIHRCHYSGKWPDGHYLVHGQGDLWPSNPNLFRPLAPESTP